GPRSSGCRGELRQVTRYSSPGHVEALANVSVRRSAGTERRHLGQVVFEAERLLCPAHYPLLVLAIDVDASLCGGQDQQIGHLQVEAHALGRGIEPRQGAQTSQRFVLCIVQVDAVVDHSSSYLSCVCRLAALTDLRLVVSGPPFVTSAIYGIRRLTDVYT